MSDLMDLLFKTHAFKICKPNDPFWYTSGKIGPYFINADYLYGSEEESKEFLKFIDLELEHEAKEDIPGHLLQRIIDHYHTNEIYRDVVNQMKEFIEKNIVVSKIDYISGGERRDWYYSIILSYLLGIPHVTIFKDLTTVESDSDFTHSEIVKSIPGKNFLHVADLLNQSASFIRGWIPAIKNLGSHIEWSLFAVDRMQGGTETLNEVGVKVYAMLNIDDSLFVRAKDLGIIDDSQLEMLRQFREDPDGSMKRFLKAHPEFIENAKNSKSEKTRKRVNLMLEKDIYGLNE